MPKDIKGGGICEKTQIPPPVVYRYNGLKTAPDDGLTQTKFTLGD